MRAFWKPKRRSHTFTIVTLRQGEMGVGMVPGEAFELSADNGTFCIVKLIGDRRVRIEILMDDDRVPDAVPELIASA